MLSRTSKELFYLLAGPIMKINGLVRRRINSSKKVNSKIHLGPGQNNYIDGWVNVDANMFTGRCDIWADLRNPLPFEDESVSCAYSHHMIEHLPNIEEHIKDVYRCLKPGGVYRVGGPNGDSAIKKFIDHDLQWFSDFPDSRKSIGGRLENFIFCRGEHLTILTFSHLDEILRMSGFTEINICKPSKETGYPELFEPCLRMESETDFVTPHTLIIEAVKPYKED